MAAPRAHRDGTEPRQRAVESGRLERLRHCAPLWGGDRAGGGAGVGGGTCERRRRRRALSCCGGSGGECRQQLRHAGVVQGDALLELQLQPSLLRHALVELAARIADHVADEDADDEPAEERGEPVARGDRPRGPKRAERDRPDEHAREGADRDARAADRASLGLVVSDELLDGFLPRFLLGSHGVPIGRPSAALEEDGQIARC